MSVVPDSSLRQQIEHALHRELVDHGFDGYPDFAPAFRAGVWPLIAAGLAAARADEREKIQALIEATRLNWPSGPSEFNQGRDVGFIMAESVVARSAGVEPKEQQT